MKIESQDISVKKLLNGNFFRIPRFQRPYSWELDQISDFWSDVTDSLGDNYFIGSMVVYSSPDELLNVVDGQQRLTTISIFLAALRDGFLETGDTSLASGLQRFIETKDTDNIDTYILKTETSFPYLQETVFKMEPPDITMDVGSEEVAIAKSYEFFRSRVFEEINAYRGEDGSLSEVDKEKATQRLKDIRDSVLSLNHSHFLG